MTTITELRQHLIELAKLNSALAVLGWDQEVYLPPKGLAFRGQVQAMLAAELHCRATEPAFVKLSKRLAQPTQLKKLSRDQKVVARETWRDVDKATKLPTKHIEELSLLTSQAFGVWVRARQAADFKQFAPVLTKIVKLKQREAELLGYKQSPYDALIDIYEPDMTSAQLDILFKPLAAELSNLIKSVGSRRKLNLPAASYPIAKQQQLNELIAAKLGYDLEAGRIDTAPHPFMIDIHATDARITTRYDEHNFWISTGSVIHEVGHALYEQGLPAAEFGTPLGESVSLGIHESQSRLWENFIGRSAAFSKYLHKQLRPAFGASKIKYTAGQLHAWLNQIQPSLIRVEADEITYNLHIIIRYEIEKALVEGQLKVKDLPTVWNSKYADYLGIKVPNDAVGVLQDIHWSHGSFGYFPTYSLGNLYAAQIFAAARKALPNLDADIARGDFVKLLGWLRQNIHSQGRRYRPAELIKKVTGQLPSADWLIKHLRTIVGG